MLPDKKPDQNPSPAKPESGKETAREEAEAKARKVADATLSRYMSWVQTLKGRHAFRGQANAAWGLWSSAYRRLLGKSVEPEFMGYLFIGYLHERVNEVRMRFSKQGDLQPLEVMAQMQHHGAATGLIDFTESPLAALWFACKDESGSDGKVFAVRLDNAGKIREIKTRDGLKGDLDKFFPIIPPDKLWVWRPGDGDSRMITQQSLFIFGHPGIGSEFVSDDFTVQASEKGEVFALLEKLGVSETFMFSDFAGFAAANASVKDYLPQRAKIYYSEKIDKSPKNSNWHFRRGIVSMVLGDYQEARVDLDQVIKIDPNHAIAHSAQSVVLVNLEHYEEALAACDRAIVLDPNLAMAHNSRGTVLLALGRPKEALTAYDRAIDLDPDHAWAHSNRGGLLFTFGRHEEALAAYDRAIELDPNLAMAHNGRGAPLLALGRRKEALMACDRAIEIDPNYEGAYGNRGTVKIRLGDAEGAIADWKKAKRLAERSGNEDLAKQSARFLAEHDKPE